MRWRRSHHKIRPEYSIIPAVMLAVLLPLSVMAAQPHQLKIEANASKWVHYD